MKLQVSPISQIPIYEQIKMQIKEQIFSGSLPAGTQLPSIRVLARELKIGVITSKRAYDDLCEEGILISHSGKGIFVAEIDTAYVKMIHLEMLREQLSEIKNLCDSSGITKEELKQQIDEIFSEKKA